MIDHIKWRTSHIGLASIAEIERRNLPPKYLKKYIKLRDEYEMIFRKTLKQLIARGEFRDMDPKLATFFTLGVVNSLTRWYRPEGPLSPSDIASEAYKFISKGLEQKKC